MIIKNLRESKNETQSDLSEVMQVSLRTIQNWESGKITPPVEKLKQLAKHYCVNVSVFIEENGKASESRISKEEIGKRLNQILTRNRLSNREVGKLLSVSEGTIRNYRHLGTKNISHLEKLAKFFNIDKNWLIYGEGDKNYPDKADEPQSKHTTSKNRSFPDFLESALDSESNMALLVRFLSRNHERLIKDELFQMYHSRLINDFKKKEIISEIKKDLGDRTHG